MVFGSLVVSHGKASRQFQFVPAATVLMSLSNLHNPVVRSDHNKLLAPPRSILRQSPFLKPFHSSVFLSQQFFFRETGGATVTLAGGCARSSHSLRVLERGYCGGAAETDIKVPVPVDRSHEDDHDDDEDGGLDNEERSVEENSDEDSSCEGADREDPTYRFIKPDGRSMLEDLRFRKDIDQKDTFDEPMDELEDIEECAWILHGHEELPFIRRLVGGGDDLKETPRKERDQWKYIYGK